MAVRRAAAPRRPRRGPGPTKPPPRRGTSARGWAGTRSGRGRWGEAAQRLPRRVRPAVSRTVGRLMAAAALERTGDRAAAVLAALHDPLRARSPDAAARLADLQRLADAAATQPSLHEALVELA